MYEELVVFYKEAVAQYFEQHFSVILSIIIPPTLHIHVHSSTIIVFTARVAKPDS